MPPKDAKFVCQDEELEFIYLWWRLGRNPPLGAYLATTGFLGFSSEASGSDLQKSHTKILSLSRAVSSCQDIFIDRRWTLTSLLKLCPTHILRMVQNLPARLSLCLPFLPQSKHKQWAAFLRLDGGVILVHCTPQAVRGKRKEQNFLLKSPEKHLPWLLLLLSACTVNTTTCYSHCIQQL